LLRDSNAEPSSETDKFPSSIQKVTVHQHFV
jgi:hypothetical protein